MHRLTPILLSLSALFAFDVPSPVTYRNETKLNVTVIHDPAVPFARFGMLYYWPGHYKHSPSTPKKCIFLKNHPDWPFGEYLYSNGTIVSGVEFGCETDELCRKYKCDRSITLGLIWCVLLLIASIISIGIIIRYMIGRTEEEDERAQVNQDTEMRSVYIPIVVVHQDSNGCLDVPPMHPTNFE
ncbi:hypothetical protein GCK72_019320 [Caenorhabditis remanei]|uniref:CX domain-containing protein n=1 Tax=Caenorhabditis remanei TaxID=31234 RepID=A0A6A5GDN1_CAERE|nr:hypothetical protein GCK72_019320 [Caenorhabditis remanei]KAF1752765.1 hypothetical protein GCK72_019320 [Caenorhabditis remanei]